MNKIRTNHKPWRLSSLTYTAGLVSLVLAVALSLTSGVALSASPAATAPGLGAAASYSALGKAGVTNTGNSVLSGNVSADGSITGFPPGSAAGKLVAPTVNGAEADASTADLALTAQAGGATPAVLMGVAGVDLADVRALTARRWVQIGLGSLGLGLVLVGFALRRKHVG